MDKKQLEQAFKKFEAALPAPLIRIIAPCMPELDFTFQAFNAPPMKKCVCDRIDNMSLRTPSLFEEPFAKADADYQRILLQHQADMDERIQLWLTTGTTEEEIEEFFQKQYDTYFKDLWKACNSILLEDSMCGEIHIPCLMMYLHQDTFVQSRHSGNDINYSPVLMTIHHNVDSLSNCASLIAASLLLYMSTCLVNIELRTNQPLSEEEYTQVINATQEFLNACNEYKRDEFEQLQDDYEYQHRYDTPEED